MNIEEGNKLILEFLGFKLINDDPQEYPQGYYHNSNDEYDLGIFENGCLQEQAEFHKSWNWLMPVVEKIEAIDWYDTAVVVNIIGVSCKIETWSYSDNILCEYNANNSHSKIENVWNACVDFIQKHNDFKV